MWGVGTEFCAPEGGEGDRKITVSRVFIANQFLVDSELAILAMAATYYEMVAARTGLVPHDEWKVPPTPLRRPGDALPTPRYFSCS